MFDMAFRGISRRPFQSHRWTFVLVGVREILLFRRRVWVRLKGHVRMAADSTMLRMVNRLMALSLGTQRAQLEQRTGLTWPRPFLLRPL